MNGYLLLALELAGILLVCMALAFVIGRNLGRKSVKPEPVFPVSNLNERTGGAEVFTGYPEPAPATTRASDLVDNDFSFVPEQPSDQSAQPQQIEVPAEPAPAQSQETMGEAGPDGIPQEQTPAKSATDTTVSAAVVDPGSEYAKLDAEGLVETEDRAAADLPDAGPTQQDSVNSQADAEDDLRKAALMDDATERIKELEKKVRQQEIEMARLETGATTAWDTTMPKMLNRIDELESELGKALKESQELHSLLEIERGKTSTDGWPTNQ